MRALSALQNSFFGETNEIQRRTITSRAAAGSTAPHLIHKALSPAARERLSQNWKLKLWTCWWSHQHRASCASGHLTMMVKYATLAFQHRLVWSSSPRALTYICSYSRSGACFRSESLTNCASVHTVAQLQRSVYRTKLVWLSGSKPQVLTV